MKMRQYLTATIRKVIIAVLLFTPFGSVKIYAVPSSSTNYSVPESSFNSGSSIDANSASYNARVSAGDLGVGTADSTSYNARPGFVSPSEEFLEFVVQTTAVNLGTLTPTTTGTGTASFYVRTYINGSYSVQTVSTAPASEAGAVLDPLITSAASTQGTEQFGINLVANTTPTIGTVPSADPSTAFANGEAAPGYNSADTFKYAVNDVIARSGSTGPAWGRTNFTISYIANVSSITEAGTYTMVHDIVASATY